MNNNFINITSENIENEHLCCIIRTKTKHEGVESKRAWLKDRLKEGHVVRKLVEKATVFIEYATLEKTWVPIEGDNYYYIYCLWVLGEYRGKGYAKSLMEYCIDDARKNGKSGICMLAAQKQKAWLSSQDFVKKYGFKTVDTTDNGYELLALSFDGSYPKFCENGKKMKIDYQDLTIFYDNQCPYIYQTVNNIRKYCDENNVKLNLVLINSLEEAKKLPCVFNNFAVFYRGNFVTVNLLDVKTIERIIK